MNNKEQFCTRSAVLRDPWRDHAAHSHMLYRRYLDDHAYLLS